MSLLRSTKVQAAVRIARNRVADLRMAMDSPGAVDEGPLPDFVVVGAMKTGTTSLSANLRQNPRIFMPPREVRFFNDHWHEGIAWYRRFFAEGAGRVCGEKTPEYMRVRRYMERIHWVVPEAKIVVLLRDPVARLMSDINHRMQAGRLPAAARIDGGYIRDVILRDPLRRRLILERGFYLEQIRDNVLPYFCRERVMILATDDRARTIERVSLRAARRKGQLIGEDDSVLTLPFLNRICDFLEVDRFTGAERFTVSGVRAYQAPVTPDAKKIAYDLYAEHNTALFGFLGYDIPAWHEEMAVGS